jgi:hypothetical protein
MAVEYTLLAGKNAMNFINDNTNTSSIFNLKQKLNISFFPVKKIQKDAFEILKCTLSQKKFVRLKYSSYLCALKFVKYLLKSSL